MDVQLFLNFGFAIIMAFGGFIIKGLQQDHKSNRENLEELIKALPNTYARRDDVHNSLSRVEEALTRIEGRQIRNG